MEVGYLNTSTFTLAGWAKTCLGSTSKRKEGGKEGQEWKGMEGARCMESLLVYCACE
jgi:hypothetical protein